MKLEPGVVTCDRTVDIFSFNKHMKENVNASHSGNGVAAPDYTLHHCRTINAMKAIARHGCLWLVAWPFMQLVIEPCVPSVFPLWTESKSSSSSSSSSSRPLLGQITALELVNTVNDLKVTTLVNGTIANFTAMGLTSPSFSIRALVNGSDIQSVQFGLDGRPNHKIENIEPYFLCGNRGRDAFKCRRLGNGGTHVGAECRIPSRGAGTVVAGYMAPPFAAPMAAHLRQCRRRSSGAATCAIWPWVRRSCSRDPTRIQWSAPITLVFRYAATWWTAPRTRSNSSSSFTMARNMTNSACHAGWMGTVTEEPTLCPYRICPGAATGVMDCGTL
jgi:hypothetical protein